MSGEAARAARTAGSRPNLAAELRIIPWWAYVLAVAAYLGIQALFHLYLWSHEPNPPRISFQVLFPLFIGLIPALLVLLIGYVNRDAGRRGMSRTVWTLVVIFVPNGIGFVLYFLFRSPIQADCPKCGMVVDPRVNYCPRCRHGFHPTCPQCKAPVGADDAYCANCGTELNRAA